VSDPYCVRPEMFLPAREEQCQTPWWFWWQETVMPGWYVYFRNNNSSIVK